MQLDDDTQIDAHDVEATPGEIETGEAPQDQGGEENDDFVIEIEGEDAEADTPVTKLLRAEIERRNARIRDLESRQVTPSVPEVGPEPQLEDFDYDGVKFAEAVRKHEAAKLAASRAESEQNSAMIERNRVLERANATYNAKAAALGRPDFEAIEQQVFAQLPDGAKNVIAQYINEPARVVYALGTNPGALAKIAAEPDPLRQLLLIRDMETRVKVKRKGPPPPEAASIQRGSAPIASQDKELERLEAQARKSGDRTEVIRHKMRMKNAA